MNLTEGKIFLDVSEKLGANETMDITTATMAIGIRGTIVYVSSEPVTDETSFAITPVYDFVLGDSGNYKINTVDATGEFDVPPIYPIDGFGMGNPSGSSSVADSSLDDEEEPSEKETDTMPVSFRSQYCYRRSVL